MEAFGWDIKVSRPTEIRQWHTRRSGTGRVTYLEARRCGQAIVLQVAQNEKDLETWVTVISVYPLDEMLELLVKRRAQTWRPSRWGRKMLFSPLRFAYVETERLRVVDVLRPDDRDIPRLSEVVQFCREHSIELATHEELAPQGSSSRWANRLCAVVPADAYELMAALYVGQRVLPLV